MAAREGEVLGGGPAPPHSGPRRLLGAWFLAAVVAWSGSARAQPSIWDEVRDPGARQRYEALTIVEGKLGAVSYGVGDVIERFRAYRESVALLEALEVDRQPDVTLWLLLADLYAEGIVGRYAAARPLLERALKVAPGSPRAAQAWFLLGIVCAKLDDPRCEHSAYTHALETAFERELRANLYLNRGESSMVLGDLEAAVDDYRRAVRLATSPDLVALSYYGLGIALERSGDLPAALEAMLRAWSSSQVHAPLSALDQPSVFFVPEYDRHYYKGLEAMALARDAHRAHDGVREAQQLRAATGAFTSYLLEADPAGHAYVENARRMRATCQRELERIERP